MMIPAPLRDQVTACIGIQLIYDQKPLGLIAIVGFACRARVWDQGDDIVLPTGHEKCHQWLHFHVLQKFSPTCPNVIQAFVGFKNHLEPFWMFFL